MQDIVILFKARKSKAESDRTQQHFFVPRKDIESEDYDLSFSRHKIDMFEEVKYEKPSVILDRLIEAEVGDVQKKT